jgi:E3 ubiquitin-protein ligase DOA10
MSLSVNRKLVLTALICLLLYQVGTWITIVAGAVWGAGAAVIVAVVSYVSARLAKRGATSTIWFLVPTLLFTVIPLLAKFWSAFTSQTGIADMLLDLTPLLVGFVIPVILLSMVYLDLRKKSLTDGI